MPRPPQPGDLIPDFALMQPDGSLRRLSQCVENRTATLLIFLRHLA
ncbi:thioredoxin domain-containing protein [Tuwongella immobilis]|nr:hypothetical protein [Tuwongella immobilis]